MPAEGYCVGDVAQLVVLSLVISLRYLEPHYCFYCTEEDPQVSQILPPPAL